MKGLLVLLLCPSVAWASSTYDISVEGGQFNLYESSVRGATVQGDFIVSAMWDVTLENKSFRWTIHVSGCANPFGSVVIDSKTWTEQYNWSIEGKRVYDSLAINSCIAYGVKARSKKQTGRNESSKHY